MLLTASTAAGFLDHLAQTTQKLPSEHSRGHEQHGCATNIEPEAEGIQRVFIQLIGRASVRSQLQMNSVVHQRYMAPRSRGKSSQLKNWLEPDF